MTMFNNQNLKRLFEKYNNTFAAEYDRLLNENDTFGQVDIDNAEEALRNTVRHSIRNWHHELLDQAVDSLSGEDVLAEIKSLSHAIELARYAAAFCDDEFPEIVKSKLASFGQPLIDSLLNDVLAADYSKKTDQLDEDNLDLPIAAEYLKLLADWHCESCMPAILNKFAEAGDPNEILADATRYFLSAFPGPAQKLLLDHINNELSLKADLDTAGEYLLISLTDISREQRSDAVFNCLRTAFRKMNRKAIAAICLGDYGDGRGVATLRGWLERNEKFNDRQTIAEILSAISRLGGETGDLRHRLKSSNK